MSGFVWDDPDGIRYNAITDSMKARARLNEQAVTCRCGAKGLYRDGSIAWCKKCGKPEGCK